MNNTEYMKKQWYKHDPLVTQVYSKEEFKDSILMWLKKNKIGSKLNIIIDGKPKKSDTKMLKNISKRIMNTYVEKYI